MRSDDVLTRLQFLRWTYCISLRLKLNCGWCERRDSNSHALRRWNLNPVRLPIPPLSRCSLPALGRIISLTRRFYFDHRTAAQLALQHQWENLRQPGERDAMRHLRQQFGM